jgi:multidrug efflux pump subunit AcrA (membrane-fusion protein)
MRRKWLAVVTVGLGVLLAGGLWLTRTPIASSEKEGAGKQKMQKSIREIRTAPAIKSPLARTVELTGELAATESVVIASLVDGPIAFCPWREGDRVEAGQKLLEIDRRIYQANVKSAEASVMVARARLEDMEAGARPEEIVKQRESVRQLEESAAYARDDFGRTAKLAESGALPGEAMDKARVEYVGQTTRLASAKEQLKMLQAGPTRTALAVQKASLAEAEARLAQEKTRLAECVIESPFSGVVTRVHVRPGDMAAAKARLLELADFSSLVARIAVPEAFTAQVRPGMMLDARVDAYPGKSFRGRVVRVYPDLDRRTRTRMVEARIAGASGAVPGMFVRLTLTLERVDDALVLPLTALLTNEAGEKTVFVAKEGRAERRIVRTGIEDSDRVQILAGIEPGEKVIVSGHRDLKDGMAVRVTAPGGQERKAPAEGAGRMGQEGKKGKGEGKK